MQEVGVPFWGWDYVKSGHMAYEGDPSFWKLPYRSHVGAI